MRSKDYIGKLGALITGKPWIVVSEVLVGCVGTANLLMDLGASRVFCLGGSRGTGEGPDPERFPQAVMGLQASDMMGGVRATVAAFLDPSTEVREALDAFDPDHSAGVIGSSLHTGEPLDGRAVYGARRPEWCALEDKIIIDALWDEAGVSRAPSRIVHAQREDLLQASQEMNQGSGTVWVGDNKEGFHGGASYLRWVRGEEDVDEAVTFLAAHCDRARVMPFLEGIPCSIHGMVFPEDVITFQPCEMLVYRVPDTNRLAYAGNATTWDPGPEQTAEMQAFAKEVGEHLRQRVAYRGAFTCDGVLTAEGFLPTELNPRLGAALERAARKFSEIPLSLINLAVIEGEDVGWHPQDLESHIRILIRQRPYVTGNQLLAVRPEQQISKTVRVEGATVRSTRKDEAPDATILVGPGTSGGFMLVMVNPDRLEPGDSAAPIVRDLLSFADREWDLGIGPLEPATDYRSPH